MVWLRKGGGLTSKLLEDTVVLRALPGVDEVGSKI